MAHEQHSLEADEGGPRNDPPPIAAGNGTPEAAPPTVIPSARPEPMPPFSDPALALPPHEPHLAPVAHVAPDPALDERIRRLEALLSQVQNLQALEQRVAERVASQIQQQPAPQPPQPSAASAMLGQARALIDVGRHLMPALPPGQGPVKPRGWLIWEMIAELRAMVYMYLDPRYRVSWYAYVVPPALFVAFLFTKFWFPFALTLEKMNLAWTVVIPVDLLLLYCMFKILGHEARRYRETAPDLPPSLRL